MTTIPQRMALNKNRIFIGEEIFTKRFESELRDAMEVLVYNSRIANMILRKDKVCKSCFVNVCMAKTALASLILIAIHLLLYTGFVLLI